MFSLPSTGCAPCGRPRRIERNTDSEEVTLVTEAKNRRNIFFGFSIIVRAQSLRPIFTNPQSVTYDPWRPMAALGINGQTRIVGIFGDPIAHTRSPAMQNAAFQSCNLPYVYAP